MMTRGGMGCGFMGGRAHRDGNAAPGGGDALHSRATSPIDPVTGEAVDPGSAISSGHHGRIYYFASRENRDRFEQSPDRYATAGGQLMASPAGIDLIVTVAERRAGESLAD